MSQSRGANASKFHSGTDRNNRGTDPRNMRGTGTRAFQGGGFRRPLDRATAFELTTFDWNSMSADAFRQHMREEKLEVKEVAELIGCSPRTAENYVQGRNSPAGVQFLRSIAAIPQFAAAVREVTGMMGDLDPRAMHQAMKVMQEASRFLDAMGANSSACDSSIVPDAGEERDVLTGDLFSQVRH